MTPAQCRAARGYLGWSQRDLALKADIARGTIADFERGVHQPGRRTIRDLVAVLTAAGLTIGNGAVYCHKETVR